jgi:hypothetical protein
LINFTKPKESGVWRSSQVKLLFFFTKSKESGVWLASQVLVKLLFTFTKPNESGVWRSSQVKLLFISTKPNESGVWRSSQIKLLFISTKPNDSGVFASLSCCLFPPNQTNQEFLRAKAVVYFHRTKRIRSFCELKLLFISTKPNDSGVFAS